MLNIINRIWHWRSTPAAFRNRSRKSTKKTIATNW